MDMPWQVGDKAIVHAPRNLFHGHEVVLVQRSPNSSDMWFCLVSAKWGETMQHFSESRLQRLPDA